MLASGRQTLLRCAGEALGEQDVIVSLTGSERDISLDGSQLGQGHVEESGRSRNLRGDASTGVDLLPGSQDGSHVLIGLNRDSLLGNARAKGGKGEIAGRAHPAVLGCKTELWPASRARDVDSRGSRRRSFARGLNVQVLGDCGLDGILNAESVRLVGMLVSTPWHSQRDSQIDGCDGCPTAHADHLRLGSPVIGLGLSPCKRSCSHLGESGNSTWLCGPTAESLFPSERPDGSNFSSLAAADAGPLIQRRGSF